jgi:hypothetical protein
MNRFRQIVSAVLVLVVPTVLATGCATRELWAEKAYHPARHPRLSLGFDSLRQDLLVEYDEQCGDSSKVQRRAYWLFEYSNTQTLRPKPTFVRAKNFPGLTPVPVLDAPPATNAPVVAGYLAVATPSQQGFELRRDGEVVEQYYLAAYLAKPESTFWRVVATPFAALGDALVIVAAAAVVVGFIAGIAYLESESKNY